MYVGLKITRPPDNVARYKMIKHTKRKPSDWRKRFVIYATISSSCCHLCYHIFELLSSMLPYLRVVVIYATISSSCCHLCYHIFELLSSMLPYLRVVVIYATIIIFELLSSMLPYLRVVVIYATISTSCCDCQVHAVIESMLDQCVFAIIIVECGICYHLLSGALFTRVISD